METDQIDDLLVRTMADFRVSRGEKKVLHDLLEVAGQDEQKLAFLRHRAFELARRELLGPQAKDVVNWLEDVSKVLMPRVDTGRPDVEVCFSPGDECVNTVTRLLKQSKRHVDICVFTITDNRISTEIEEAHERGVAVRIISDDDKAEDTGSDVQQLQDRGLRVRVDRTRHHMHHKFAVFDGKRVLTGSYNWTRSASEYNEENLLVTSDLRAVRIFSDKFVELWNELGDGRNGRAGE